LSLESDVITINKLHNDSIIIDGLFHSLLEDPPMDPEEDIVDKLVFGGVTAINLTIQPEIFPMDMLELLKAIYSHLELFSVFPNKVVQVTNTKDIIKAKEDNKLGIIFGLQGAGGLRGDLRYLLILYHLGFRIIQLTYNHRNELGYGVYEPVDHGLTRFGQQVVRQMNQLGILVDLSHAGLKTSLDAIEYSEDPVIFSHSSVKKLCDHKRNITDEQIIKVAERGGVIGICPHAIMCQQTDDRPTLNEQFIEQIAYVANLVGVDHVGIGTDRFRTLTFYHKLRRVSFERTLPGFYGKFSGNEKHVKDFNTYSEWPNVTESLINKGFSSEEVKKVLGGNFLRVFEQVWDKSERFINFRKELLT